MYIIEIEDGTNDVVKGVVVSNDTTFGEVKNIIQRIKGKSGNVFGEFDIEMLTEYLPKDCKFYKCKKGTDVYNATI